MTLSKLRQRQTAVSQTDPMTLLQEERGEVIHRTSTTYDAAELIQNRLNAECAFDCMDLRQNANEVVTPHH